MISKTSFFLIGAIASVLLVSGMITEEASAFEPTEKEQKIIERYVKVAVIIEQECSSESEDTSACDKLEEIQMRLLIKLNDMGIFVDDQEPSLNHLTEEVSSTRAAAAAGIEPIEITEDEVSMVCPTCNPKTMYVKSAYKDPWTWFGITFWDHYAGVDSADIETGETTSSLFKPRWSGTNSGMVPYCQTSSVTLTANASYTLGTLVTTTYGAGLINTSNSHSSVFVWYDPNDQIGNQKINNLTEGFDITCSLTNVTVS